MIITDYIPTSTYVKRDKKTVVGPEMKNLLFRKQIFIQKK